MILVPPNLVQNHRFHADFLSLYMFATPFSDMRTLAPTILYIFTYWIKSQVCQQPPTTVDALSGPPSHPAKDQRDIPIFFH